MLAFLVMKADERVDEQGLNAEFQVCSESGTACFEEHFLLLP